MKVVVTGSCGYLASNYINFLLNSHYGAKYSITAFDNLMYRQGMLNFKTISHPQVKFFNEDVRDWSKNLCSAIAEADIILPMAAIVGMPCCAKNPELCWSINYEWFVKLQDYLNNQVLFFPNTNSVYGNTGLPVDEESPINTLSDYAKSKQMAEELLKKYHRFIGVRFATVFGLGQTNRPRLDLLVNNLVLKAVRASFLELYDSEFQRNYIHVEDTARLIHHMTHKNGLFEDGLVKFGEVYNAGNTKLNCSKRELAQAICGYTKAEYICKNDQTDPDQRSYVVLNDKLESTNFRCLYSLDYGIKELVEYYNLLDGLDDSPMLRNY